MIVSEIIEFIKDRKVKIIQVRETDVQKTLDILNEQLISIVKQWLDAGFSVEEASRWITYYYFKDFSFDYDPKEAFEWFLKGFKVDEYHVWSEKRHYRLERMLDWRNEGFSLDEVNSFFKNGINSPEEAKEKAIYGELLFDEGYDFLKIYRFMNPHKADFHILLEEKAFIFHFEDLNKYGGISVLMNYPTNYPTHRKYGEVLNPLDVKIKEKYFRDFITVNSNDKYETNFIFYYNRLHLNKQTEENLPKTKTIIPYYEDLGENDFWIGNNLQFEGIKSDENVIGETMILQAGCKLTLSELLKKVIISNEFESIEDDVVRVPLKAKGSVHVNLGIDEREKSSYFSFKFVFDDSNLKDYNYKLFEKGRFINILEMEINNIDAHTSLHMPYFRRIAEGLKLMREFSESDGEVEFKMWLVEGDDPKTEECVLEVSTTNLRIFLLPENYGSAN